MIDLKKLIGAFLVLATITSVLAFTLLNPFSNANPANSNLITAVNDAASNLPSGVPQNAFVARPSAQSGQVIGSDGLPQLTPTSNLTEYVAQSVALELVKSNPDGPKTADGKSSITPPSVEDVMNPFLANGTLKNISIPDWGIDAKSEKINIVENYTTGDLTNYGDSLNKITDKYFVQSSIAELANNKSLTADDFPSVSRALAAANKEMISLQTPKPLADFHKSFVELLSYERNAVNLAENANDDPMKASVVFQAQQKKYDLALINFQKEFEKIKSIKGISGSGAPAGLLSLLNEVVGIKTAYAFWPTFDAAQFGNMIKEFVTKTLVQILKNTLIKQIQAQILRFIQGGGKPRFITNWKGFLGDAVTGATNAALMRDIAPTLCPSYASRVLSSLGILNSRFAGGGGGSCPRDRALAMNGTNINLFTSNFDNGGWAAYSTVLQNNVYLATIDASDKLLKAESSAKEVAQTKSVANQGMKGTEVCQDGSDPEGLSCWCHSDDQGDYQVGCNEVCYGGVPPELYENFGQCADGSEPQTTTPATGVGETLKKALTSNIDLVVNADDLAGLAAAVTESLMVKLINMGVAGLLSTNQSAPTTPLPQPPSVSCGPASQSANVGDVMIFGAMGGNGSYFWSSGGGTSAANTGPMLEVSFGVPGIYTVSVTSEGRTANCTATAVQPPITTTPAAPFGG